MQLLPNDADWLFHWHLEFTEFIEVKLLPARSLLNLRHDIEFLEPPSAASAMPYSTRIRLVLIGKRYARERAVPTEQQRFVAVATLVHIDRERQSIGERHAGRGRFDAGLAFEHRLDRSPRVRSAHPDAHTVALQQRGRSAGIVCWSRRLQTFPETLKKPFGTRICQNIKSCCHKHDAALAGGRSQDARRRRLARGALVVLFRCGRFRLQPGEE